MKIGTEFKLHGKFICTLKDLQGNVIEVQESENLVVTSGKEFYANLIGSGASGIGDAAINYLGVGTDASSPALTDIQLVAEIERSPNEEPTSTVGTTTSIDFVFGATEAIGNLKEVGC